jgi:NTE family protein
MNRTALVLGAGGLGGQAFEAGVLHALHDATGFDAREAGLIVGTSAGSMTGASLRFGLSAHDLAAHLTDEPLSREGRAIFDTLGPLPDTPSLSRPRFFKVPSGRLVVGAVRHPWRSRAGLLCAIAPTGTIDMAPFAEFFAKLTGDGWSERDLWIVASALPLGERVIFGRDATCDVPTAVTASCAIPGVFRPVKIDGRRYVDGGVHSPTNADLLIDAGYDEVIIVSPMSADRASVRSRRVNPVRHIFRAMLGTEVRALRRAGIDVTVIQPSLREQRLMGMNALDDSRSADIVRASYDATIARLNRAERLAA